uniref:alpha-1,6-mannosyl-glycoprotein 6-beta-N-acetylglucosaminyltransferase n=2 Tax=Trichobilharzia regenti TaxID=157069 RepID=A0AA85JUQ3_TRIRE|nr:unnamed protein product [Trichobilharzia regenti]
MRRYPIKFRTVITIVLLFCILGVLWLISRPNKSVVEYRNDIISLSQQYIKALASTQNIGSDDAYSAELTGYDLKKTLAVILDDLLRRIDLIESKLSNQTDTSIKSVKESPENVNPQPVATHTLRTLKMRSNEAFNKTVDHLALLRGVQEKCIVRDLPLFPECLSKIEWLRNSWKEHKCYGELGVDGTECSFVRYLSEIESFCPYLDSRKIFKRRNEAKITQDLEGLLALFSSDDSHSEAVMFIQSRIKRMWPDWLTGIQYYLNGITSQSLSIDQCRERCLSDNISCITLCQSKSFTGQPALYGRSKLNVLIYLGFLSKGKDSFESHITSGGPLGELVQWTDLIAGLYILGHNITITFEVEKTKRHLLYPYTDTIPCQVDSNKYDLVYTDISGFKKLESKAIRIPLCKFRILDTFGTEASYNRKSETWGGLHLNLQQFYTFFPHTPDNSFMGFISEIFPLKVKSKLPTSKPVALISGKENYMWSGKANYLKILSDYFELHGNVLDNVENLPKFVKYHKLVYGEPYLELLSKVHIMIGLGFPYEGPAPLEAISNGIIFLNPRFNPPHGRANKEFFSSKPTSRALTSQHPYIEKYIGEPYSYLVDMDNETQIRSTVQRILSNINIESYRPHEYSPWGFLERLNAYLTHQDFCSSPFYHKLIQSPLPVVQINQTSLFNYLDVPGASVSWPPPSSLKIVIGSPGKSCVDVCGELRSNKSSIFPSANVDTLKNQKIWTDYLSYRSVHSAPPRNTSYLGTLHCTPEHFTSVNNRLNLQYFGISCHNITYAASSVAPYWDWVTKSCVFQADNEWFDCVSSTSVKGTNEFSRFCPCRDALPNQISMCTDCL